MAQVKVIAKRDFDSVFKKGDKLTIIGVLYEEDTVIVNERYGVFEGDKFIRIADKFDLTRKLVGMELRKIFDKQYAPKGSYRGSVIELEDGTRYPGSLVRSYEDYFEIVKE